MAPKIALVADKKENIDIYLANFRKYDAEIIVCKSFKELERCLALESYNGIIVDLKTKLSVPRDQKATAHELLEHYPVLQSRIVPDSGLLQTMAFGKTQYDVSMEDFLSEECSNFAARKIRFKWMGSRLMGTQALPILRLIIVHLKIMDSRIKLSQEAASKT